MRIVVYAPNLIGDSVMATPLLRALRGGWPDGRLDLIVRPQVAPVFDGNPWIDERIRFDPRGRDASFSARAVVARLRRERYDLGILLPNSFRSAWILWRGGVARRIGYARGGRGPLLTDRLIAPRQNWRTYLPVPAVDYYGALLGPLGIAGASMRCELFTTPENEAAADAVWSRLGLGEGGRPVVVLNTGGAFGPAKSWPAESFAELARWLAASDGADVLVICGPAERDVARLIAAHAQHPRVMSLADETLSIGLSKACVRRASAMVTTDSGPRHFATGFGTPVVTLFGPTHIAWTRTYHPQAVHLRVPVPCGPCQRPTCHEGHHRCMRDLDVASVHMAVKRFLPAPGPSSAIPRPHVRRPGFSPSSSPSPPIERPSPP
jgi:heptosyltransferase-2